MKRDLNMTFEEFPLNVPSEKRIINKLDSLIQELEECGSAMTATLAIKHWNKYMTQLSTDMSVIMVRYTCDTKNPVYKRAQDRVDELSPIIANYANKFSKILTKAKYRKDLEKKFGKYYFQMMDASLKTFDEKIIPELIQANTWNQEEMLGHHLADVFEQLALRSSDDVHHAVSIGPLLTPTQNLLK